MRMVFSLVGLMVTMLIVLFMLAGPIGAGGQSYLGTVAQKNKQARQQVQNFSGRDANTGGRADAAVTLVPSDDGKAQTVETVIPAGELVAKYNLQPGDTIRKIGPHEVGGFVIDGSERSVRDFLTDAFARDFPIEVTDWEGNRLTLPAPGRKLPPTAATPAPVPAAPATPAPAPDVPTAGDGYKLPRIPGL